MGQARWVPRHRRISQRTRPAGRDRDHDPNAPRVRGEQQPRHDPQGRGSVGCQPGASTRPGWHPDTARGLGSSGTGEPAGPADEGCPRRADLGDSTKGRWEPCRATANAEESWGRP